MGVKTVRMDAKDERILSDIVSKTGLTSSAAVKQGLRALQRELAAKLSSRPYEIYVKLDLGPGGYASGPSTKSREVARAAILKRHGR